jgi:hypothetical protein
MRGRHALRLGGIDVEHRELVTRFREMSRHRRAHHAEADETDSHRRTLRPELGVTPSRAEPS